MAFVIAVDLQPDAQDVTLPVTLTFTATFRDDEAPENPGPSALKLRLAASNDLSFVPPGAKVKPVPRAIHKTDKKFSFTARIEGTAEDLGAFRVALVFPDGQESGCLVRLA